MMDVRLAVAPVGVPGIAVVPVAGGHHPQPMAHLEGVQRAEALVTVSRISGEGRATVLRVAPGRVHLHQPVELRVPVGPVNREEARAGVMGDGQRPGPALTQRLPEVRRGVTPIRDLVVTGAGRVVREVRPARVAVVDVPVPVLQRGPFVGRDDHEPPILVVLVHLLHPLVPVVLVAKLPVVLGDGEDIEPGDISRVGVVLLQRACPAASPGAVLLARMSVQVAEVHVVLAHPRRLGVLTRRRDRGINVALEDGLGEHIHVNLEPSARRLTVEGHHVNARPAALRQHLLRHLQHHDPVGRGAFFRDVSVQLQRLVLARPGVSLHLVGERDLALPPDAALLRHIEGDQVRGDPRRGVELDLEPARGLREDGAHPHPDGEHEDDPSRARAGRDLAGPELEVTAAVLVDVVGRSRIGEGGDPLPLAVCASPLGDLREAWHEVRAVLAQHLRLDLLFGTPPAAVCVHLEHRFSPPRRLRADYAPGRLSDCRRESSVGQLLTCETLRWAQGRSAILIPHGREKNLPPSLRSG